MQLHLIAVSVFLKTCVKDYEDNFMKKDLKWQVIMRMSNFKKNLFRGFKIICLFVKEDQNVPKPLPRAPNQIPPSSNRLISMIFHTRSV